MGHNTNHQPLWFDQLELGKTLSLPDIHCSDELVAGYARLFNANHPLHVDDDYARKSRFGQRIVHGPIPIAASLAAVGDYFGEALIAMLGIESWRFLGPIVVGATVTAQFKIAELHPHASKPQGRVLIAVDILDPDGNPLQQGSSGMMLAKQPT